ncbi:hypothetical protein MMC10_004381 [Thelotrema lepadinum]|nr:hypothetical protein [Thelotrema lepadinum]
MSDPRALAKLCRVCQQVNFAAILTPREWDAEAKISKTIYRLEWTGNGKSPDLEWTNFGKTKRTGPPEDYLPQVRTASYDDRSVSSWESFEDSLVAVRRAAYVDDAGGSGDEDGKAEENLSYVSGESESSMPTTASECGQRDSAEECGRTRTREPIVQVPEAMQNKQNRTDSPWGYFKEKPGPENETNAGEGKSGLYESCIQDETAGWFEDEGDLDDDGYDSDTSASTWSNYSHFTEIQRIDLEKQAQGDWSYRHGQLYYLGSIWDLRSRRHECDLCRRLWQQTRENPHIREIYLTKSRCIFKLMKLGGRRNDGSNSEVSMLNLVYIYGYKVDDPRNGQWNVRTPFVIQGAHRDICDLRDKTPPDQVIPFGDSLFGQARWREDECNYELFRQWLRVCETSHDHSSASEFKTDAMTIRLVDVQRKCLVEWNGSASEAPRFVALSYVWGKLQHEVMLTTSELNEFERPGFFDRPLDKTIRDAIELVSRMGEKYLWVDALCILQDSLEDKAIQIPQMHKVYGKAILTIVAAHGQDADSGLPGIDTKSRASNRFMLDLENIRLSFRSYTNVFATDLDIQFTENYLYPSNYLSRSWTFQEGHLSTRLLIFTKDQVYFECSRCTWCEETHWESDTVDFVSWRSIKNPTPQDIWEDRVDRNAYDMISPEEAKKQPPRDSYAAIVKDYTSRSLTYEEDILDACTGVLNSIGTKEQTEFLFALRTTHFGNDLLFNGMRPVLPPRFPGRIHQESGFPSWSWLSWKGVIEIANEPRNNSYDVVENLVPCDGVRCYTLQVDAGGQHRLRLLNENGGWRFQEDYERVGEGLFDPAEKFEKFALPHHHDDPEGHVPVSGQPSADNMRTALGPQQSTPSPPPSPEIPPENIPSHPQHLSLRDIQSHSSFSRLVPNYHILLRTFSTTVVLLSSDGAEAHRGTDPESIPVKRCLYACRKKRKKKKKKNRYIPAPSSPSPTTNAERQNPSSHHSPRPSSSRGEDHTLSKERGAKEDHTLTKEREEEQDDGSERFKVGSYVGYVLSPSPSNSNEEQAAQLTAHVPDDVYTLLWMNNNIVPFTGGMLCRAQKSENVSGASAPTSSTIPDVSDWDGVILERVCGAICATEITRPSVQEKFMAKWRTVVLG